MLHEIIAYIVKTVGDLGYFGIFAMMFLESSFFPFPSEVVMIPAGYLASKGEMNFFVAVACGICGSLSGALFNYYLALKLGRPFLQRYGRYVLLKEESLQKMEAFFATHGHISTFTGRLLPAVRQYISLPAGLARMNLLVFSTYTSLGAGIWVAILALLGYFIGHNQALLSEYLRLITIALVVILTVIVIFYVRIKLRKKIIVNGARS
jgi:membrane protein DedA with SNARE-associated domain